MKQLTSFMGSEDMFNSIKNLFNSLSNHSKTEADIDVNRKVAMVLMIEVALADGSFDRNERNQLVSTVSKRWAIAEIFVHDLIQSAEQQQDMSTSLFEHTRIINKYFSHEEKIDLIDCLWEIAFADGNIDHFEEHTIRKISDLIYVEHRDFIVSKIRVRDSTL